MGGKCSTIDGVGEATTATSQRRFNIDFIGSVPQNHHHLKTPGTPHQGSEDGARII